MITTTGLLNTSITSHLHDVRVCGGGGMRPFEMYSLSNFQVYNTEQYT